MVSFQDMFEQSKGKPFVYNNKTLVMADDFPIQGAKRLRLLFESSNAEWRQGVALRFEGKFKVNGQIITRGIVLWEDTAPQTVNLEVIGKLSTVQVKNVWDVGDRVRTRGITVPP